MVHLNNKRRWQAHDLVKRVPPNGNHAVDFNAVYAECPCGFSITVTKREWTKYRAKAAAQPKDDFATKAKMDRLKSYPDHLKSA